MPYTTWTGTASQYGTVVHTFGPGVILSMPGWPPMRYWGDVEDDATETT